MLEPSIALFSFLMLTAFGLTFTLASSHIALPIRKMLFKLGADFFGTMFGCYFCTGWWMSLATAFATVQVLALPSRTAYVLFVLAFPFAGATVCYAIDKLLAAVEKIAGE